MNQIFAHPDHGHIKPDEHEPYFGRAYLAVADFKIMCDGKIQKEVHHKSRTENNTEKLIFTQRIWKQKRIPYDD